MSEASCVDEEVLHTPHNLLKGNVLVTEGGLLRISADIKLHFSICFQI